MSFIENAVNTVKTTSNNMYQQGLDMVGMGTKAAEYDAADVAVAMTAGNSFMKQFTAVDTTVSCVDTTLSLLVDEEAVVEEVKDGIVKETIFDVATREAKEVEAALAAGGKEIKILSPEELKKAINNIPKKK